MVPHRSPRSCWPLALFLAAAGCGPGPGSEETTPVCKRNGRCNDPTELDGAVPSAGKNAVGGEGAATDGAPDQPARADAGDDAAHPTDLTADVTAVPPPSDAATPATPDGAPPVDTTPDPAPDVSPPDAGPETAPDARPDLATGGCPAGGRGPTMVKADLASSPFCVDATEVTNAQYAAFLAATGNGSQTGSQPAACSWNASYLPSSDGTPWPYAAGKENHPVVNVDWCDARAFCQWAGKRLCGKVGGGSLAGWSAATSTSTSQWSHACSRGGQRAYPYGAQWNAQACNTGALSEKAQYLAAVRHFPQCEGGYRGIFDMSGNVEEWVDACDKNSGASDDCASAGASAYLGGLTPAEITCTDSLYGTPRSTQYIFLGFRCCADL
jgi:hypothetical protein